MPKKPIRCFVIMPFSETSKEHTKEYWTKHFKAFLKPIIEECEHVKAYRSEPLRGDVLRRIISELVVSPVVVAELTDENPNVYWELGVRQSFKHGTITIAEEGTKLPFDISVKGTLFYYPKNHIKNAEFIQQFKRAIIDCLSHPDSPDSHVLEAVSGRGALFEIVHRDEAIRRVKGLVFECKYNVKLLKEIYDTVKKNQAKPKQRQFVAKRLRCSSVEMLITNRYLDQEDSFYEDAEVCFDALSARNDQLALWEQDPDSTEQWFLDNRWFLEHVKSFNKKLGDILNNLITSV